MAQRFDLAVIGSGPAGQKAAICAAKLRKRVVVVDRQDRIGGVSLHAGTIPSKTLREAVLYLSGFRQRAFYGRDYRLKEKIAVADLQQRVRLVLQHEIEVVRAQLKRNGVETVHGSARFESANALVVEGSDGAAAGAVERIEADRILVACGTRPAEHATIPIDGKRIFTSDQLAHVDEIPKHLVIVGGGVIGLEYASMLTALGGEVTLVDARKRILDFVDEEIVDTLTYHMRRHGVTFRLGKRSHAAEIIHIGQAALALGASVEYFRDAVFNYPTLAEAYKVAALDGLNKVAI